jgi:hypothetical protein
MTVKEYPNKSSVLKNKSRYIQGGKTDINIKRLGWWERFIDIETDQVSDITIVIDTKYDNRPDLIAHDYYKNANLAWIVLQYNNIVDIKEEFIKGKIITIPSFNRVFYDILVNSVIMQERKL